MEIKEYAPVLIPTLNRFEHFRRCFNSLEKCTGARNTELFIALDYPPSEQYRDGWQKIDSFLHEKELSCGFKKLHVIRRSYNHGIGKPDGNYELMLEEVSKLYDRFIFSEDDNEFSPNFLEYMNWGLETFAGDNSIYAVCGYNGVKISNINNNVYLYPRFNAWGCGQWIWKRKKLDVFYNWDYLYKVAKGYPLSTVWSRDFLHAYHIVRMVNRKEFYGDSIKGCLPENERYCLYPVISKVRNTGLDGSGLHGGRGKNSQILEANRIIDTENLFTPYITEDLVQPQIKAIYKKQERDEGNLIKAFARRVLFLVWKLTGINYC